MACFRNVVLMVGALVMTSASASATDFVCKTTSAMKDGKVNTVSFSLSGLNTRKLKFEGDQELPYRVKPEASMLVALNDNYVINVDSHGNLVAKGDADGIYLVRMILFKDQGYRSGYVRIEDIGGMTANGSEYSTISCTVR